ncbi:AI-2E family transporter, partial [Streptococcus agalactiae]|nr:AI-2E family transporter [Streptococcus agalactiae]MCK6341836.1 AI-2E family transporter [Streptococcus agalactiae]
SVSMILSYATFIGLIVWLFSIVIPDLISSLSSLLVIDTGALAKLVNNLNENKQISEALNYMGTDKDLVSTLSGYSQQILKQVLSVLTNLLTSVSSIAATLL